MIPFFRKIRKKMADDNKPLKYIRYAIGEIILVVIGILIALSINNWNETQKSIKNEEELIISLKKEITNNILELESSVEENNMYFESINKLIHSLKLKDELFNIKDIDMAFSYKPYKVDSPVLDRIIETSTDVLIENKEHLSDFRLLKKSYAKIAVFTDSLEEFWNLRGTEFFIAIGIWDENEGIDYQISLKEMALDGYSKKKFIALLKIQKGFHNKWKQSRIDATEQSKEILNDLN